MLRLHTWLVAAGIGAAVACSDSSTAPAASPELGTYRLVHVNGVALPAPYVLSDSVTTAIATNGTLVLTETKATKTWSAEVTLTGIGGTLGTPTNQIFSGTYTRDADTVYFRDASDGTIIPAKLTGTQLVAVVDGVSFGFERK